MKKYFHFLAFILLVFSFVNSTYAQEKSVKHKVEDGETIRSIALKYKITPYELIRLNPDLSDPPKAGTLIIIESKDDAKTPDVDLESTEVEIIDNAVKPEVVTKTVDGFIYHKVKAKETLYGLSKLYGVEIDDIIKHNPSVKDGLQLDVVLKIPEVKKVEVVTDNRDRSKYFYHVVEAKETQWGLCHKYGISQKELLEFNPQVANGLNIGDTLWFPKKKAVESQEEPQLAYDYTFYEVQPKDTKYGISKMHEISMEELNKANPVLDSLGLKIGMVLRVPKSAKQIYDTSKVEAKTFSNLPNDEVLTDKEKIAELDKFDIDNVIDVVVMLPFYLKENKEYIKFSENPGKYADLSEEEKPKMYSKSQIALNFYNGALMAIDSLKRMGLSVRLRVFDTENRLETIDQIFEENSFSGVDVVIGPLYTTNAEYVADKLKYENILVVSPLSKKIDLENRYNLIQAMPDEMSSKNKVIRQLVAEKRDSSQILVYGGYLDSQEIDFVKRELKTYVDSSIVKVYVAPENLVERELVIDMMEPNKDNIVVIASKSNVLVTDVITAMNQVTDSLPGRAYLLDRPQILDQLDSRYLNNVELVYPEQFYLDKSDAKIKSFEKEYRIKFRSLPDKYAYRGYDVTYDMLYSLAKNSNLEVGILDNNKRILQSRFNYKRQPFGGYFNNGVFLLRYDNWKLVDISE